MVLKCSTGLPVPVIENGGTWNQALGSQFRYWTISLGRSSSVLQCGPAMIASSFRSACQRASGLWLESLANRQST